MTELLCFRSYPGSADAMWEFISAFWFYLLILLFFLVVFTSLLAVGLLEKQYVREFALIPPESRPPASRYFTAMNDAARQLGYEPGEVACQARNSSTYHCCLAFWLSPDKRSLLCIGGGKLSVLDYKRTLFLSKVESGLILQTTDNCGSEDLSGTRDIELLLNAHLLELHELHERRLSALSAPAAIFAPADMLGQYEALNEIRVKALIQRGLARFVDGEGNAFRLTVKGALLNATSGYLKGMRRAQAQRERVKLKRPGS